MRNVICCWCSRDASFFENQVPLLFTGKRNLRLGFSNDIDLLFLDGFELLGDGYKGRLEETGYRLHDAGKIYRECAGNYPALGRFIDYERKCFLRWLVLAAYFAAEPVLHYDGDIVFNEDPKVISRLLQGRTFVLQGCPAVTCIGSRDWFEQYRDQLELFTKDIPGYSEQAWKEREGWQLSEREKWAGQRYREVISSDQDLLSHLIHTDRIRQDRPSMLMEDLSPYLVFENPLYLHGHRPACSPLPLSYQRNSGIDYISGKRVLTWHMQCDFNLYLSTFLFRKKYLPGAKKRLSNHLIEKTIDYRLNCLVSRLRGSANARLEVYRYFFEQHDFSEVLSGSTWWDQGAFV